jgi:catechol 2,3-dioxygenase-like lactoylglutathione lyase family enzyme
VIKTRIAKPVNRDSWLNREILDECVGIAHDSTRTPSCVALGTLVVERVRIESVYQADGLPGEKMRVLHIDHVLLAMPVGREAEARAFYQGALGIPEQVKPAHLAARGGCWFESGPLKVHLGVDKEFVPARKAHPAFVVENLSDLVAKLEQGGYRVVEDLPLDGYHRRYVDDPFGNRIELMEPIR